MTGVEPTGEKGDLLTDMLTGAENLPEQTETYHELYNYFCENVLERLFKEKHRI